MVVGYPVIEAPAGIVTVPVNVGFAMGALRLTDVFVAYVSAASSEESFNPIAVFNEVTPP